VWLGVFDAVRRNPGSGRAPADDVVVAAAKRSPCACGGVGMGPVLTLQGSEADGVYGLLNNTQHIPIKWPPGYRAVFEPSLMVLAPNGTPVAKLGDDLLQPQIRGGLIVCTEGTQIEMIPL